jgi:hypothetical protein
MMLSPGGAQIGKVGGEDLPDFLDPRFRDPTRAYIAQFDRASGAVQHEHRFEVCAHDMHMGRPMVGRVDHDPQSICVEDRRHPCSLTQRRWVFAGSL